MLNDVIASYGGRFFLAAGVVGVALLVLVGVLWIIRNRAPSPFVRGGKNRQPRLQVLDAAAVDARRRLVLVRRDDVEHLVMIGGPTDIVIESRIGAPRESAAEMRPVWAEPPVAKSEGLPKRAEPALTDGRNDRADVSRRPAPEEKNPEPLAPALERPRPAPVSAPSSPAPEPVELAEKKPQQQLAQPGQSQAGPAQPSSAPPNAPKRPKPAAPAVAQAADVLESARQRVLTQPPRSLASPPPAIPPQRQSETEAAPNREQPSPPEGGAPGRPEFQRILDDEFAKGLTADRLGAAPAPAPAAPTVRRDQDPPPITGDDMALQNEVARIFGEMSVNRDK